MNLQMLDHDEAHEYVTNNTPNVWWENYDIIVWSYNPAGFRSKYGLYRRNKSGGGKWGTHRRIKVSDDGKWKVNVN